jgi:hypothetical protein
VHPEMILIYFPHNRETCCCINNTDNCVLTVLSLNDFIAYIRPVQACQHSACQRIILNSQGITLLCHSTDRFHNKFCELNRQLRNLFLQQDEGVNISSNSVHPCD